MFCFESLRVVLFNKCSHLGNLWREELLRGIFTAGTCSSSGRVSAQALRDGFAAFLRLLHCRWALITIPERLRDKLVSKVLTADGSRGLSMQWFLALSGCWMESGGVVGAFKRRNHSEKFLVRSMLHQGPSKSTARISSAGEPIQESKT